MSNSKQEYETLLCQQKRHTTFKVGDKVRLKATMYNSNSMGLDIQPFDSEVVAVGNSVVEYEGATYQCGLAMCYIKYGDKLLYCKYEQLELI